MSETGAAVEAWRAFCAALADAGELVLDPLAADETIRADGIRALSRYATLALERCVERSDVDRPTFLDLQAPIRKYMGDNPDQTYRVAAISGDNEYRISDTVEGAIAVEVAVYAGDFGGSGGRRLVAAADDTTLAIGPDGTFEVVLSADDRVGNHLRLEPDASSVLIRTYFTDLDLRARHPMPCIERVPAGTPAPLPTADELSRQLERAAMFTSGSFGWWMAMRKAESTPDRVNRLTPLPDEGDLLAPAAVRYVSGDWRLEPDQALVLDFDPNEGADYWSVVVMTLWGETVDWRERPAVVNHAEAARRSDGSVRVVIAHADPGVPNWLDTGGHAAGSVSLRWFRTANPLPIVDATLMRLTDVTP